MAAAALLSAVIGTIIPILFVSFAAAVGVSRGEQQRLGLSSPSTRDTDVIIVSFEQKPSNEGHTLFARLVDKAMTTWRVPGRLLLSHVIRNGKQGKKSVLVGADPSTPIDDVPKLVSAANLSRFCVSWLFLRPNSETLSHEMVSWPHLSPCQSISLVVLNDTAAGEALSPAASTAAPNHTWRASLQDAKYHPVESKRLSGQRLTVACARANFYGDDHQDSCHHALAWNIFRLLKDNCNVSLDLKLMSIKNMVLGTVSHKWDVAYIIALIYDHDFFVFDFPFTVIDHETFFSRKSAHRTVELSEVGRESWRLVVATLTLLVFVAVAQVLVTEGPRPSVHGTTGTATLLLAAVLATSATVAVTRTRRGVFGHRVLLGLWFVSILPLSAYLRSELTSIVTLRRPAERIDTLEELEHALDRREVAPCAAVHSAAWGHLTDEEQYAVQAPLMRKLRAAFQHHDIEKLSTFSFPDCLACALRRDRVFFAMLEEPCDLRERFPEVREFRHHFKVLLSGLRVRKSLPAYRPLRRFFLAIQEGKLIPPLDAECRYDDASGTFEFHLDSLFIQHAMLQVASCVVLVVEMFVVWCSQFKRRLLNA